MKKRGLSRRKKTILILVAAVIFILLALFGTQIYLYVNLLLGNDVLIKLSSSKEYFDLTTGKEEAVSFTASVATNPFCRAQCHSLFESVSDKKVLDQESFTLRPGAPFHRSYVLKKEKKGKGKELYRFNLQCQSSSSFFCHTTEEPTTRNILVTVNYDLNEEEKEEQAEIKEQMTEILNRTSEIYLRLQSSSQAAAELNRVMNVSLISTEVAKLREDLKNAESEIKRIERNWKGYEFSEMREKISLLPLTKLEGKEQELNLKINRLLGEYSQGRNKTVEFQRQIQQLSSWPEIDKNLSESIRQAYLGFEELKALSASLGEQQFREELNKFIAKKESQLANLTQEGEEQALFSLVEGDVILDAFCLQTGMCLVHPTFEERFSSRNHTLTEACSYRSRVQNQIGEARVPLSAAIPIQDYPATEEFARNISFLAQNARQQAIALYLEGSENYESGDGNSARRNLIRKKFPPQEMLPVGNYSQYNLTPALSRELYLFAPRECALSNFTEEERKQLENETLNLIESVLPQPKIELAGEAPVLAYFDLPPLQCCLWGKCEPCCNDPSCRSNPETFPVVFLHGHAISEGSSAEYSLEGFNQIQSQMEKDGYLNAGAITLYASKKTPPGEWGYFRAPLTIRASYYFDVFEQEDNYVIIPTKSENLDTYAIRLKDLIDTIKYKTGKEKVNLVAFSMGGLVARRSLQLFGESSVHKLILIGTPNQGIVGEVAEYCSLLGGSRECQDLNSESTFLKKLNSKQAPAVPVYNIYGTGCRMKEGQGDGAVLEEKAKLDYARNFLIKGDCPSKVEPLHLQMRNLDKYPKVYEIIKVSLEEREE